MGFRVWGLGFWVKGLGSEPDIAISMMPRNSFLLVMMMMMMFLIRIVITTIIIILTIILVIRVTIS